MICDGQLCNLAFRVGENLDNPKKGLWPNSYLLNLGGTALSPAEQKQTIGSITDSVRRRHGAALDAGLVPGRWFEMELIVRGSHFKVLIDGKQVLDCRDGTNAFPRGRILLQCRPNTVVKFEKVEIKELPAGDADLDREIELEPKKAEAWSARGRYYARLNQWDRALADYTKATELEPENAQVWHLRAHAHEGLQQWDRAFADFAEAIELSPKDLSHLCCRGRCYFNLGQYEKAIADYSKGIELNPKDGNPHNHLAWLLATAAKPEVRDSGRAIDLAQKAVELAPKEGSFWTTLGVAHYRARDWKAALAALEKSMELRQGGDGVEWFFLAMSHKKVGDNESARQWYDRATRWTDKNRTRTNPITRSFAVSEPRRPSCWGWTRRKSRLLQVSQPFSVSRRMPQHRVSRTDPVMSAPPAADNPALRHSWQRREK